MTSHKGLEGDERWQATKDSKVMSDDKPQGLQGDER